MDEYLYGYPFEYKWTEKLNQSWPFGEYQYNDILLNN
jgi:hypothetical protein